ncbi:MAG: GDP-mannose 4,6-dehydratase [Actinomycetota bacterium]|nr:GDP-mannose 4,6-dehydratase [Actinomycetota bacterium]
MSGLDAVVHLAARPSVFRCLQDPVVPQSVSASGTLLRLETVLRAEGPPGVDPASSSVYGATPSLPKHEDLRSAPISPCEVSKLTAKSYATAYGVCFGLPMLALCFFNVYDPLQTAGYASSAVILAFISVALGGAEFVVHGDGHQTRGFTFVGSVIEEPSDAVREGVTAPGPFDVAFGIRASLLDVVADLKSILVIPLPRCHVAHRAMDVRDFQTSPTRLRELLPGVEPVPLRAGLEQTLTWLAS